MLLCVPLVGQGEPDGPPGYDTCLHTTVSFLFFPSKKYLYGKKTIFPLQTKKRERTERCDAQFKLNSNFFVPV